MSLRTSCWFARPFPALHQCGRSLVVSILHTMVTTRRKAESAAWLDAMQTVAKLPDDVVLQISRNWLDNCCAAASLEGIEPQAWANESCSTVFADLDKFRRISKAFNERISANPAFLQLLVCERLRALERLTWTEGGSWTPKKLPKSFVLQFPNPQDHGSSSSSEGGSNVSSSSSSSVSSATFHIERCHQSASQCFVEARHTDSTPAQVRLPVAAHTGQHVAGSKFPSKSVLRQCATESPRSQTRLGCCC